MEFGDALNIYFTSAFYFTLGSILIYKAIMHYKYYSFLKNNGKSTIGEIISLSRIQNYQSESDNTEFLYAPLVRYTDKNGKIHLNKLGIATSFRLPNFKPGVKVKLIYNPEKPEEVCASFELKAIYISILVIIGGSALITYSILQLL